MKCYNHPDINAVAACSQCGRATCEICAVNVGGRVVCQTCLATGQTRSAARAAPTRTPGSGMTSNSLAVVSVVLGVLGLLGCVCGGGLGGIVLGLPAAIVGWIARKQISENPAQAEAKPLAMTGLILGAVEFAIGMLWLVLIGGALGLSVIQELL